MRILVTGASGLIGSHLSQRLRADGHSVIPLKRLSSNVNETPAWRPEEGIINLPSGAALEAVVHLAGENIGQRWTKAAKQRIWSSRVEGTALLSAAVARLDPKPQVLVSASAVGYYGHRGEEPLDEMCPPGTGFLAELCQKWEAATIAAVQAGIRVVTPRFGIVLAPGGALARMLPLFRMGLGGRIGNGEQFWSWMAIDDAVQMIRTTLEDGRYVGPVNAVSPEPVRNKDFTKVLAEVLHRPAIFPAPAFGLKLLLGDMANEALLASCRAFPKRLQERQFSWRYTDLKEALSAILLASS